jgi:acetyl-CoA C-acetyltransferase
MILMSEERALWLKPLAFIKSYADAAQEPKWFTTSPSKLFLKR